MNAESNKVREALADQLSELDESLGATIADAAMLTDLKAQIGRLLASGAAEKEIRSLLQDRFDRGDLRRETFQLVKSVLDRYSTEQVETSPFDDERTATDWAGGTHAELHADDEFASTTVITPGIGNPESPDDRVQAGSVLCDRYLLKQRVSGGSMGVVYKAMDQQAGGSASPVAIKVLSPQLSKSDAALRALQQEAAKGRCLQHPNIVRFIDLDRDDDLSFIVMEWMPGRTLADVLDSPETRRFGVDAALDIVRQVGRALDYAHRCGIVHADVKPGNIMILPDGKAKLFDFGVARVEQTKFRDGFDPAELGAITPAYSSRQVLAGDEPVPADDVYALGCLAYRLIAGYRVFGPRNAAEAAAEGMQPQRLDALSDRQWAALQRALAFSRTDRFESMAAFMEALFDDAALGKTNGQRPGDNGKGRRKPWWLVTPVIFVLAAGVVYQSGWLDGLAGSRLDGGAASRPAATVTPQTDTRPAGAIAEIGPPSPEPDPAATAAADRADPSSLAPEPPAEAPVEAIVDFSDLPPADHRLVLAQGPAVASTVVVTLRENAPGVTVDLFRGGAGDGGLNLKLEEVRHSGNRSPWAARQFTIPDDGLVRIPPGQDRARITLTMAPDPLREADQQSTLRVRIAEAAQSELGLLDVVLEDDDQRAFEARLPPNTVAFAVSQVSVSEQDPAVQVDILRFNPDQQPLSADYRLSDITATQGQDYFGAGNATVSFAPGQRSARVLVPLVQDTSAEGDEAFAVELLGDGSDAAGVYRRQVVIIRDDEIARP